MSINEIISYVPQSAIQQVNRFVNILSSVDNKIYFFATAIASLAVLLASREIKSRKLEKKVIELTELSENYSIFCDRLNNLLIDKEEGNFLNKKNISELLKANACLIGKNSELNNKIYELSLINGVLKENQRGLIDEVQNIRKEVEAGANKQSYIHNHINVELQDLSRRQEERHEGVLEKITEVLENITEVKESQIHSSRTIYDRIDKQVINVNDQIHKQVISAGVMFEKARSYSRTVAGTSTSYLSRQWSDFCKALSGMSFP